MPLVRLQLVEAAHLAAEPLEPLLALLDDLVQVLVGPHGIPHRATPIVLTSPTNCGSVSRCQERFFERAVLGQVPRQVFIVPQLVELVGLLADQFVDRQGPLFVPRRGLLEQDRQLGEFFIGQIIHDLQKRFQVAVGDLVADVARLEKFLRSRSAACQDEAENGDETRGQRGANPAGRTGGRAAERAAIRAHPGALVLHPSLSGRAERPVNAR